MALSRRDEESAKMLRQLVSLVKDIKEMNAAKKPIPHVTLGVDPPWVRQNPGRAAKTITLLRDALIRAIVHCDRAKHKDNRYRDERDAIVAALGGPLEK